MIGKLPFIIAKLSYKFKEINTINLTIIFNIVDLSYKVWVGSKRWFGILSVRRGEKFD
jgi:hypothetical protein